MKSLLIFLVSITTLGVFSQDASKTKAAFITFDEQSFDFGDITQGDVVKHTFKFKNTGSDTLRLSNVTTTCGCTTPKWTKEAIAPGETGEILASFNSTGKIGLQNKVITVMSNASNSQAVFSIRANILVAPGDNMRVTPKQ